jgi:hypothetical protein
VRSGAHNRPIWEERATPPREDTRTEQHFFGQAELPQAPLRNNGATMLDYSTWVGSV